MKKQKRSRWMLVATAAFVAGWVLLPGQMMAGDLEPPAAPGPTMKTLDETPPTWSQKLDASERFKLVLDGNAVLDKETGLVWERSPYPAVFTWMNACANCYDKEIDGRKGWRLPTIEELASLVDTTQSGPCLPSGHPFLDVQISTFYWSSTSHGANYAWRIRFTNGSVVHYDKNYEFYYWCVRGSHAHDDPY